MGWRFRQCAASCSACAQKGRRSVLNFNQISGICVPLYLSTMQWPAAERKTSTTTWDLYVQSSTHGRRFTSCLQDTLTDAKKSCDKYYFMKLNLNWEMLLCLQQGCRPSHLAQHPEALPPPHHCRHPRLAHLLLTAKHRANFRH